MISKLSSHLGPGSIFAGESPLIMEFSSGTWLSSYIGDWESLNNWNTFFGTIGTEFKNIDVVGNKITLSGGKNLTLKEYCFSSSDLLSIDDSSGVIVSLGTGSFTTCTQFTTAILKGVTQSFSSVFYENNSLTEVVLPKLQTISGEYGYSFYNCNSLTSISLPSLVSVGGYAMLFNCSSLTNISLPLCVSLGETVGNESNFGGISGKTIDLTVSPELLTCNSGAPDGDIQNLQSGNTVSIHIPTTITSFSPVYATYSGSIVSVVGKGFYGINSVKLGGVDVATYSLDTFTNMTITTGTVSSGSLSISGLYGSASKSGFEWNASLKFSYIANSENVTVTNNGRIKFLILGDTNVNILGGGINTELGDRRYNSSYVYRQLDNVTETGADITTENYDVVIYSPLYTVYGSNTLADNLKSYVNSGGHLITNSLMWSDYPSNFDFGLTPFTASGTRANDPNTNPDPVTNLISNQIVNSGFPSGALLYLDGANTNGDVQLNAGATAISIFTSNGFNAIAYKTIGSSKLIGINMSPTNYTISYRLLANCILWALDKPNNFEAGNWNDLSSYGNDLSLYYGVTKPDSYSLKFDGSSNAYGTSSAVVLNYPNGFTIETWVDFLSLSGTNYIYRIIDGDSNYNRYLDLYANDSDLLIGSSNTVSFATTLQANRFIKAVITYNSTNNETKTYINGVLTNTSTLSLDNGSTKTVGTLRVGNPFGDPIRIGMLNFTNYVQDATTIYNNYESEKLIYSEDKGSYLLNSSSNQYLSSSSPDYVIGTNSFTLEAFVKTSALSGFDGVISMYDESTLTGVAINIASGYFDFLSYGHEYTSFTVSNDVWYHVAMSRDAGTISYFVDGELLVQYADTNNYTNSNLVIGRYYTDGDYHYIDGVITQPMLTIGESKYNSSFTPTYPLSVGSNAKFLLNGICNNQLGDSSGLTHSVSSPNGNGWTNSVPLYYITDGLICYLDAENTSSYNGGSTWYDLSGRGNNATLYGVTYSTDNGGVIRFAGTTSSKGEINLDLRTTPCTIMYGTRYLQNTPGYRPSGRCLGGVHNNWLLGTWVNQVNRFFSDSSQWIVSGTATDMNWHIYTGTIVGAMQFWDGGYKMYNGVEGGNGPYGIALGSDFLDESSNCDISFVLVYNKVLNDDEVALNFNHFRGRLGL